MPEDEDGMLEDSDMEEIQIGPAAEEEVAAADFSIGPEFSVAEETEFRTRLLGWYNTAKRHLPWRSSPDPYRVWISEIMLQQTRVQAVIPYYERFLSRFPTVNSLASAPEDDLLSYWAGLGYYYRARNLQKAAQSIVAAGGFPSDYDGIRQLPGVGDYTAAAVASICFNLPYAVLDGNVYRVLSRVFNDATDIASSRAKKHFNVLARRLFDEQNAGAYNQAMMELGATICLPKQPQCLLCPVASVCRARMAGTQAHLPVKKKKARSIEIERTLYWIEQGDSMLLWQRPATSRLMPGFWELPEAEHLGQKPTGTVEVGCFNHGITIYRYKFRVMTCVPPLDIGECRWIRKNELTDIPLSTIYRKAQRAMSKTHKGKAASAAS